MTFEEYLKSHDINGDSVKKFGLSLNGNEFVIPVVDQDDKFLYNKYRNLNFDKNDSESIKFRFDYGSKVTLFNSGTLKGDKDYVVLCEGEIDCIRLDQEDILAVSGTAGVSTFRDEWIKELRGTVEKTAIRAEVIEQLKKFRNQVNPRSDVNAILKSWDEFKHTVGTQIPVPQAQELKKGTYKILADKYAHMGTVGEIGRASCRERA